MKSRIFKPPLAHDTFRRHSLFLAGSIEMGVAENWQARVERELADLPLDIYNPRRDDWDSSWEQKIENIQFRTQVLWELRALEKASQILLYFDPTTKSPISLLEMGLFANSGKLMVICPDGFWRKGNVDIVCHRYGIAMVNSLDDAIGIYKVLFKEE